MSKQATPDNKRPIDKAVGILKSVQDGSVNASDIPSEIGRVISLLDGDIRNANVRLRELAEYWKGEADDWKREYQESLQ